MRRRSYLGIAILTVAVAGTSAQSLSFDATSVRPSRETRARGTPLQGGRLTMSGMTLGELIVAAYLVHRSQVIGGPSWMTSERFDIDAVIAHPPSDSAEVRMQLLRSLLADRFGLRARMETRDRDAFVLRVARPGRPLPRGIEPSQSSCDGLTADERRANTREGWPPCGQARITNVPDPGGRGETTRQMRSALTMDEFAAALIPVFGEPVVNATGLSGRFDLAFEYVRPLPGGFAGEVPEGPRVEAALDEQLGLRVGRQRARVPVLVIDAAARPEPD
jgi:uncharacterized protein (TIGR03435 family)